MTIQRAPDPARLRTRTALIVTLGGLALLGWLCLPLCAFVFPFAGAFLPVTAPSRTPPRGDSPLAPEATAAGHVIDAFMDAMAAGDSAGAYALYSTRAQSIITPSDLDALLTGDTADRFAGYRTITIEAAELTYASGSDPATPQGQVALLNGRVIYANRSAHRYAAVLELEAGAWRLDSLDLDPPPALPTPDRPYQQGRQP